MENIVYLISNVGFPIAVSIALFYQMSKTNETYLKLLREFQDIINNNTQSINLLKETVEDIQNVLNDR